MTQIRNTSYYREQAINSTQIPANIVKALHGRGINTVGALMDTDSFRTLISGRYNLENVRAVNGIPIEALQWLVDAVSDAS